MGSSSPLRIDLVLFKRLLASLGPPASCCGDPGLQAGLLSGFVLCSVYLFQTSKGCISQGTTLESNPCSGSRCPSPV